MLDWKNAVVVVTGGASGIGRELALAAAARGALVAIADIQPELAETNCTLIRAQGGQARAYGCDVADADAVAALAERVAADFGGVNVLFNNAGVFSGGTIEQTEIMDAAWMISINIIGVLNAMKAFLPHLRQSAERGQLAWTVTTGSENSLGVPKLGPASVYTMTKHALLGLTDCLRRDLQGSGIGVALLCPSLVATDIADARRNRPAQFGGAVHIPPDRAAKLQAKLEAEAQKPGLTAQLCFEGLDRGDFLIITDPSIRDFAIKRTDEIMGALDLIAQHLPH